MTPFMQSTGGRVILVAAALFLGTTGWYTLTHNLYVLGIGMPAGITLAFVGTGLAMPEGYLGECLFVVTVLPCALWGLIYATGEADYRAQPWLGYVFTFLAIVAIGKALVGKSGEATA